MNAEELGEISLLVLNSEVVLSLHFPASTRKSRQTGLLGPNYQEDDAVAWKMNQTNAQVPAKSLIG